MISKFLILWLVLSLGAGSWLFIFGKPEKRTMVAVGWRVLVSGAVGGVALWALYLLNNVQGL